MRCCFSIPGPVSTTAILIKPSICSTLISTVLLGSEYLIALSIKLTSACSIRLGLAITLYPPASWICTSVPRSDARCAQASTAAKTISSTAHDSNSSCPRSPLASSCARVSRSETISFNRSACRPIILRNFFSDSGSCIAPSKRVSTKPLIEVMGVRSSCDTLATKSVRTCSSL